MVASDAIANLGDVSALSIGEENLAETRFYREVLQPFDIRDIIWFPALRTGSRMASMHASRSEKLSYYDKHEIDVFKLIAPHVCRSLAISDALDIRTIKSEMLERTLDKLLAGVFLTARDGQVVYMNAAAQRQIKDAKAMRLVNNRLCPVDPAAHAALSKTLAQAASGKYDINLASHSLAIPGKTGQGYVATFLPMEQSERREIFAPYAATCAIFMQDPQVSPLMPGEAFARLHGLTGAELRVLLALSQGLGGKESADILGISEPTVRSFTAHLLEDWHDPAEQPVASAPQFDTCRSVAQITPSRETGQCLMRGEINLAIRLDQVRLFEIVVNLAFRLVPIDVTAVMITTAIKPAMRPYSIAVAPDSVVRVEIGSTLDIPQRQDLHTSPELSFFPVFP